MDKTLMDQVREDISHFEQRRVTAKESEARVDSGLGSRRESMARDISELSDDELKEIIFELGGRPYLTEEESQRFNEAVEEADTRWKKEVKSG